MSSVVDNIKNFIYSLNLNYVILIQSICLILVIVLLTTLISGMIKSEQFKKSTGQFLKTSNMYLEKRLKASNSKSFNYDEIQNYINSSGLGYMTNYKITPVTYMLAKIGIALFLFIVGLQAHILFGLIFMIVGYFGLDFIVDQSDKSDNKKMLSDIENLYDTLRIQTKAGVYISSVLTDCYLVVKNKRLKSALLKLTSDIAAKNDMNEALDSFQGMFRNEYIDTFVIVVKQSMKTGQASKMFEDIRSQIEDINDAMILNEKEAIRTKIVTVQVIIYIAIIIVSIYVCFVSLQGSL